MKKLHRPKQDLINKRKFYPKATHVMNSKLANRKIDKKSKSQNKIKHIQLVFEIQNNKRR